MPVMGIPGFVTWLEQASPEAVVAVPAETPREADVVAFDMNGLLHSALRSSRDEDEAILRVFQMLHANLKSVRPRSTVLLAIDGAAPLAKMETQRKRRVSTSNRQERKKRGVSALCATPGTRFMGALEAALVYWCCAELSTQRARHLTFELSGSDVPGEGEVKILEWILARGEERCGKIAIIGGDGDLVLQALTLSASSMFVLREAPRKKDAGVGVCVMALRASLASARGLTLPLTLDDLEALACFTLMGNDYLPKVKEVSLCLT